MLAKPALPILVVALLLAAVLSVQPAAGTALCWQAPLAEGSCKVPYPAGEFFSGSAGEVTFQTAAGEVACAESAIEIEPTEAATPTGAGLHVRYPETLFFSCALAQTACVVTAIGLPQSGLVLWTSGGDGEATLEKSTSGTAGVKIACGAAIACVYRFSSPLDFAGAASAATLSASEDSLEAVSGECPGKAAAASWSAVYELFEPFGGRAYVADNAPTVAWCSENQTPCPAKATYGAGTPLVAGLNAGTKAKFKLTITEEGESIEYTIPCESSSLEAESSAATGWPLPGEATALSFAECGGTCSVTSLGLPFMTESEASGGGNGVFEIGPPGGAAPRLRAKCIGAYKCTYETPSLETTVTGGAPAKLAVNAVLGTLVIAESEEKCGSQLRWEASYTLSRPEAGAKAKLWIVREGV